jgi:hypothetical protein
MWIYRQQSGQIYDTSGASIGFAYSGRDAGLNNGAMQNVPDVGPIPCGLYDIGEAYGHSEHGPIVMQLHPHPENEMFGRSAFLIHGDLISAPGKFEASKGCIVANINIRAAIARSADKLLQVIA